jgi:putative transposase
MNQVARLSLVDRADAELSIVTQCRLLKVARSSLYWRSAAASEDDLRLMRRIDELYLATPFYGARRMVAVLRRDGWTVNRKRVRRLMRLMRIEAIYQQPNTSAVIWTMLFILIFCVVSRSIGRTRCGAPTSPTSRWRRGSCI